MVKKINNQYKHDVESMLYVFVDKFSEEKWYSKYDVIIRDNCV